MQITFPETRTISSRLTWQDYRTFREKCLEHGTTMHRVIRLLVGQWLVESEARVSPRLFRSVALERERVGSIYPAGYVTPDRAAAMLDTVERLFDAIAADDTEIR